MISAMCLTVATRSYPCFMWFAEFDRVPEEAVEREAAVELFVLRLQRQRHLFVFLFFEDRVGYHNSSAAAQCFSHCPLLCYSPQP